MVEIYKKISEKTIVICASSAEEIEMYRKVIANQFLDDGNYTSFTNPVTETIAVLSSVRKSIDEMVEVVTELTSGESYDFEVYNMIDGVNLN